MPANKGISLDIQIGFKEMLRECKKLADLHSDIVSLHYDPDHFTIEFKDKEQPSDFFLQIINPGKIETKGQPTQITATYKRKPRSESKLEEFISSTQMNRIPAVVSSWISIVHSFNTFSLEPDSTIEKHYADSFYEELKSAESDADEMPFDDEKQAYLIHFLEYIVSQTKEQAKVDLEVAQIHANAKTLKSNISRSTKNKILRGLSGLGAKIKMQGPDFAKGLFKTAKDEAIKFVLKELLTGGWQSITNLLHNG